MWGIGMDDFGVLCVWGFCGDSHGFSCVWDSFIHSFIHLLQNPNNKRVYMFTTSSGGKSMCT